MIKVTVVFEDLRQTWSKIDVSVWHDRCLKEDIPICEILFSPSVSVPTKHAIISNPGEKSKIVKNEKNPQKHSENHHQILQISLSKVFFDSLSISTGDHYWS